MPAAGEAEAGLPRPQRTWAAGIVATAVAMAVMDGIMMTVALPAIGRELGISAAASIWVVGSYQLAIAMVLLPMGRLALVKGPRRIYLGCIALFGVASLACALSVDVVTLSLARFVQGCGGAGMMGITNAMLRSIHPPLGLARGVSVNAMAVALALTAGPVIVAIVLGFVSWHWLFIANLPLVAGLLLMGRQVLPADPPPARTGRPAFDRGEALLCAGAIGALILLLNSLAHDMDMPVILALAVMTAGLWALVRRRRPSLLPLSLLRRRGYRLTVATTFCAAAIQLISYIGIPFLLLDRGCTQAEIGFYFMAWPLALAAASPLAVRLANRVAPGRLCAVGLLLVAAGLAILALTPNDAGSADILWRIALCGASYALFQIPNTRALVVSVPLAEAPTASVTGALGRVMGQAAGAALVAMAFAGWPDQRAVIALLLASGMALLAAFISGLRTPNSTSGT